MVPQRLWTKDFIGISLCNFFLFLAFYFLLVTLPVYALKDMGATAGQAGLLTTVFLLAAILIRPIAGQWLERTSTRLVLIFSLALFTLPTFLYFLADSMPIMFTVRFLQGLGFGMTTTVAGAIVSNIIPKERRGEGMGYYVMAANLAMVLGPFLGLTIMQNLGSSAMFVTNVILAIGGMIAGLSLKLPKETKEILGPISLHPSGMFERSSVPISFIAAFLGLSYAGVLSFVSVYAESLDLIAVSSYFFVVYAAILLLSRPFTGRWFDHYGSNVIVVPCVVIFAIGMFILSMTTTPLMFLLSALLIGLGWGTLFSTFQTIAIQDAPSTKRGLAIATYLSIFDFGVGVGSFVVGIVIAGIGFQSFYGYSTLYILVGLGLYWFFYGRKIENRMTEQVAEK
ncbi:hypothetical protein KP78_28170 [Jeotgalibacillus soli]|uniref:Major facilitator superfamily (MFS) profile domain-containing protein n=1 Tax=Jeotgalibacillus soli TaxID=889306 RepID=A0A0C2VMP2_9BACL|nr:hypothetical protein KP78_28170 [Jeotgalibacillus soli]